MCNDVSNVAEVAVGSKGVSDVTTGDTVGIKGGSDVTTEDAEGKKDVCYGARDVTTGDVGRKDITFETVGLIGVCVVVKLEVARSGDDCLFNTKT